ncbi:hypothetical protein CR152_11995 [Massilia violaceinigra]|uniref:Uncharacterized protein n=1 Tax=Massilia violaceinigra TaxID=2045208 RepID=A0A2D2DJL8_9BURK|nr:hypothetical protein CR152_11995 [Massilia violaceinigra]
MEYGVVFRGQSSFSTREEPAQCQFVDGDLRNRIELSPESLSARKLNVKFSGVLGMGAVAVLIALTTNHKFNVRLQFRILCKVTVMSGNYNYCLLWLKRMAQSECVNCVDAEQIPLSPWRISIPLGHG